MKLKRIKDNIVIIDENFLEFVVWVDYRDDILENSIKFYVESKKKLILDFRRWFNDLEVEVL